MRSFSWWFFFLFAILFYICCSFVVTFSAYLYQNIFMIHTILQYVILMFIEQSEFEYTYEYVQIYIVYYKCSLDIFFGRFFLCKRGYIFRWLFAALNIDRSLWKIWEMVLALRRIWIEMEMAIFWKKKNEKNWSINWFQME